jgi:hypothetical protein
VCRRHFFHCRIPHFWNISIRPVPSARANGCRSKLPFFVCTLKF